MLIQFFWENIIKFEYPNHQKPAITVASAHQTLLYIHGVKCADTDPNYLNKILLTVEELFQVIFGTIIIPSNYYFIVDIYPYRAS
jgi:hypothetical protein